MKAFLQLKDGSEVEGHMNIYPRHLKLSWRFDGYDKSNKQSAHFYTDKLFLDAKAAIDHFTQYFGRIEEK